MNHQQFVERVNYNTSILKNALKNDINLIAVADKFYTFQSEPEGLHFSVLMRNLHDIIPSVYLGALANVKNNGADAFIVNADQSITPLEIKTCEINSSKVWKGSRGGLSLGIGTSSTQRQALRSAISGSYRCYTEENLCSKNMRTVLFIADTDNMLVSNTFLDAWELPGNIVIKYLKLSNNVARNIKLGSFIQNGFRSKTVVPLKGFLELECALQKNALNRDEWLDMNGYKI